MPRQKLFHVTNGHILTVFSRSFPEVFQEFYFKNVILRTWRPFLSNNFFRARARAHAYMDMVVDLCALIMHIDTR
jgi:hypothetical protein